MTEIPANLLAQLSTPIVLIVGFLVWLFRRPGPEEKAARQRMNHVKLAYQNVLAGQDMLTIVLVIIATDEDARRHLQATSRNLDKSRKLAKSLCNPSNLLSKELLEEQLKVNKLYREYFRHARRLSPHVYRKKFDAYFRPFGGWAAFERDFNHAPLDTLKKNDPFWETE